MRSWSTFSRKNSWNSLQDKPAILVDNKIDWEEIQNKPFNNPEIIPGTNSGDKGIVIKDFDDYGNPSIQFNRGKSGYTQTPFIYIDWAWQDDKDYDIRLAMDRNYFVLDFSNGNHKLALIGLPNQATGLVAGCLWRDANGFLKIV